MTGAESDAILARLTSLHPKKIDLSLERMHRILADLGHPERTLPPSVLVAGTNGKGSVQAMMRAGLEGAGARVHAYTSPHLAWFHERIRVSGALIGEATLAEALARAEAANQGRPITFFEITTAAAFIAFAEADADWALLEIGLGGRLDATNVVTPRLCVITQISLDHQQWLGERVGQIAAEKAGILKPDVPCIVSRQVPEALDAIEAEAERVGAPLLIQDRDWQVWEERDIVVFQDLSGLEELPRPRLIGAHQVINAGTAVAALRTLGTGDLSRALTEADWPARLQRLKGGPLIERAKPAELWLDGGHNEAAGRALAEAVRRLPPRPLHLICGMLKTKDPTAFLTAFKGLAESLTAVSIPGEAATLPAEDTAEAARRAGLEASVADSTGDAIDALPREGARILICGSLYLAGRILRENG
ncbi:MAG: folylpolyglutamate synthase/dihydrofolate synthase family protein [Pseudomonadota bacterium]